jgi:hypothetical protein
MQLSVTGISRVLCGPDQLGHPGVVEQRAYVDELGDPGGSGAIVGVEVKPLGFAQ